MITSKLGYIEDRMAELKREIQITGDLSEKNDLERELNRWVERYCDEVQALECESVWQYEQDRLSRNCA